MTSASHPCMQAKAEAEEEVGARLAELRELGRQLGVARARAEELAKQVAARRAALPVSVKLLFLSVPL